MSKKFLIAAIDSVLESLGDNTIHYDWDFLKHDNVGILAQAITCKTADELYVDYLLDMVKNYGLTDPRTIGVKSKHIKARCPINWTYLLRSFYPVSGEPTVAIFKMLKEAGLSRSDIANLEDLSDEKIIKKAGITKNDVLVKRYYFKKTGFLWNRRLERKEKQISVPYYQDTNNYYRYLVAWRHILSKATATPANAPVWLTKKTPDSGNYIAEPIGFVEYNTVKYYYRNIQELEELKGHFIGLELYEAVKFVDAEILKLKKTNNP